MLDPAHLPRWNRLSPLNAINGEERNSKQAYLDCFAYLFNAYCCISFAVKPTVYDPNGNGKVKIKVFI